MLAPIGEDFIDVPYNITIPATEEESNGIFMIPDTMSVIVDDDIDEIKQSFALVAQLGSDVPDSFTCFQKRSFDTECFGRCGVTVITIVDDDGKYVFPGLYIPLHLCYSCRHNHWIQSEKTDSNGE